jgi:hypothetical protein
MRVSKESSEIAGAKEPSDAFSRELPEAKINIEQPAASEKFTADLKIERIVF